MIEDFDWMIWSEAEPQAGAALCHHHLNLHQDAKDILPSSFFFFRDPRVHVALLYMASVQSEPISRKRIWIDLFKEAVVGKLCRRLPHTDARCILPRSSSIQYCAFAVQNPIASKRQSVDSAFWSIKSRLL